MTHRAAGELLPRLRPGPAPLPLHGPARPCTALVRVRAGVVWVWGHLASAQHCTCSCEALVHERIREGEGGVGSAAGGLRRLCWLQVCNHPFMFPDAEPLDGALASEELVSGSGALRGEQVAGFGGCGEGVAGSGARVGWATPHLTPHTSQQHRVSAKPSCPGLRCAPCHIKERVAPSCMHARMHGACRHLT